MTYGTEVLVFRTAIVIFSCVPIGSIAFFFTSLDFRCLDFRCMCYTQHLVYRYVITY